MSAWTVLRQCSFRGSGCSATFIMRPSCPRTSCWFGGTMSRPLRSPKNMTPFASESKSCVVALRPIGGSRRNLWFSRYTSRPSGSAPRHEHTPSFSSRQAPMISWGEDSMSTAPLSTQRCTVPPRSGSAMCTSPMHAGCLPPELMPRTVKLHGLIEPLMNFDLLRTTCRRAPVSQTSADGKFSSPRMAMSSSRSTKSMFTV